MATKLGTDIGGIVHKGLHEVTFPPRIPMHGQPIMFSATSPAAAGGAALCGQALVSLTCVTAILQGQKEGLGLPGCSAGPRWVLLAVSCPGADSELRASPQAAACSHPLPEKEHFISPVCSCNPRRTPPWMLQRLLPHSPDLITAGAAGTELAVTRNVLKGPGGSC